MLQKLLSRVWLFVTPWIAPDFPVHHPSWSLLKLVSILSVMPYNHLILCHPLLLLLSSFPSLRVFSNDSVLLIRWPNYWSFSISASNEYSGLISFKIDWFDLLAVQGTPIVFSSTRVQKHQLFSAQPSLWLNSHIRTRLLEKPYHWLYGPLSAKWYLCFIICCLGLSQLFFQGASVF